MGSNRTCAFATPSSQRFQSAAKHPQPVLHSSSIPSCQAMNLLSPHMLRCSVAAFGDASDTRAVGGCVIGQTWTKPLGASK